MTRLTPASFLFFRNRRDSIRLKSTFPCCRCCFRTRKVDVISLSSSLGSSLFLWTRFLCVRFELGNPWVAARIIEHKFPRKPKKSTRGEVWNTKVVQGASKGNGMNKDRWYWGSYVLTDLISEPIPLHVWRVPYVFWKICSPFIYIDEFD